MALSSEQATVLQRIVHRLTSADLATFRAGGRAAALQAIERRGEMVQALRGPLSELSERDLDEHRRGYLDALEDVLLAAEAALEPVEKETQATRELEAAPLLKRALDQVVAAPTTPKILAGAIRVSPATATRCFQKLRELDLLMQLPASDGRERPHRATPLGARLSRVVTAPVPAEGARREAPPAEARLDPMAAALSAFRRANSCDNPQLVAVKRLLDKQCEVFRKAKAPLAVVRVDVDGYEELLAEKGFATVDRWMIDVADKLKDLLAPANLERYGPDKFLLILQDLGADDAKGAIDRMKVKLSPVTASIGIADLDAAKYVDGETLLTGSEQALAAAKSQGPGTSAIWSPSRTARQRR